MSFKRQNIRDYYLHDTRVENVFINEYMTSAPGDYVKVYLFALMYAEIDVPLTNKIIAKQLSVAEEDVLKAWSYWEAQGIIKKHFKSKEDAFNYDVELLNIREMVYGRKAREKKKDKGDEKKVQDRARALMNDRDLSRMYNDIERITGRPFDGKEPEEILSWIEDYNVKPDLVLYAYRYCVNNRKNNKYKYVGAVLKEWADKGFKTIEEAEKFLEETDNRHFLYKRVLKSLGMLRNPTEQEKKIMDTWFDDMGFDLTKVLEACGKTSGISNPNINYVNSILKAWSQGDTSPKREGAAGQSSISQSTLINMVMKSYDEDRIKNETVAKERRQEVYKAVPRIKEIEDESRRLGMEISRVMLSGGPQGRQAVREIKEKVDHLNREKAFLLTDHNFTIDYMDIPFTCKSCKDTGVLDTGERCSCFAQKLASLERP